MPAPRSPLPFRSILCPVDFSAHSRQALRSAAAVAEQFGAHVTVLFVNDPFLLAAARAACRKPDAFADRSRKELTRFVMKSARRLSPRRIRIIVTAGNPADEILHEAKRQHSSLVVMGTHGLSGVRRLFFGSTTAQVLHRSNVPVLAVPPKSAARGTTATRLIVDRVIAPIDLTGDWHSDAIRAAKISKAWKAKLLLVHILQPIHAPAWLHAPRGGNERRRMQKARRVLARIASQLSSIIETGWSVAIGDPAREIAKLTRHGSPMVVMSLRGAAGMWGRRGAMAYHVLAHASTPVLALPRRRIGGRLSVRLRRALNELLARDRIEMAGY